MKKVFLFALFFIFPLFLFGQDLRYVPEAKGTLIQNQYYCLDFNSEQKQANWVYYMLTQTHISGNAQRSSAFKDCKQGDIVSASQKDYKGSGYDRGHLCPAADMKLSKEAMKETFQMWNMSPQEPSFNRGKWSELEALVRNYIKDETDTLFIVTGAVFVDNKGFIGNNEVTVPSMFYKAVYCLKKGGIGFILPNQKINDKLHVFQVPISYIEELTGIDFFPQLTKEMQIEIESQISWWD